MSIDNNELPSSRDNLAAFKARSEQAKGFDQTFKHLKITDKPAVAGDASTRDAQVHDIKDSHKKNFDEKIYMFPEAYNALRKELFENWPNLWALVGWRMAYKAEEFVELMNDALDMQIVMDSEQVGFICDKYLTALRQRRGLSK